MSGLVVSGCRHTHKGVHASWCAIPMHGGSECFKPCHMPEITAAMLLV